MLSDEVMAKSAVAVATGRDSHTGQASSEEPDDLSCATQYPYPTILSLKNSFIGQFKNHKMAALLPSNSEAVH